MQMNPVQDLANQVCATVPSGTVGIDPISIAMILMEILSSCKKESARTAMLITEKRPNGMIARTVKRMVNDRLPSALKNQTVVDMVVTTTCKAAHNKGLWDVVYEFKDVKLNQSAIANQTFDSGEVNERRSTQPEVSGEAGDLPALREPDEIEGD